MIEVQPSPTAHSPTIHSPTISDFNEKQNTVESIVFGNVETL